MTKEPKLKAFPFPGIITLTHTHSAAKSAFAEKNIRSLENIIYKDLENKWSYHYINELQSFVQTINSRVNRMTGLAPYKVSKKHVSNLFSFTAEKSSQIVRKPKLKFFRTVRIAKEDLQFGERYKRNFTDEVFTIIKIATFNPPTYSLVDAKGGSFPARFMNQNWSAFHKMDEFVAYLESTGSMDLHEANKVVSFCNLLAERLTLECDWRVALAEIIFPSRIENVTTKDLFIYTPKTPHDNALNVNSGSAIQREYKTVMEVLSHLHSITKDKRLLLTSTVENISVEIRFREGYGLSLLDRSLFDVLAFKGVSDTNRAGFFIGCNEKLTKQLQLVIGDYPADVTAGTDLFVSSDIIEHQHIAGVKAPILRVIDTERKLSDGKLEITSSTTHNFFYRTLIQETSTRDVS